VTKISIVIPVFNAEKTIALLCNSLIALYSGKYALQIILVNDCSRDGTDAICRQLHDVHPSVITYIRFARNFGEHNAVMAGLRQVDGDYCVFMDDDLQNPPEEVDKLIVEIQGGYDAVYTSYDTKRDSIFRNMGSAFNDRIANLVLKKPPALYLSSFKVINRFLVNEIVRYDGPDPYIDGIILRSTENLGSVSVTHRERSYGSSGYTLRKLISLWGSMVMNYSVFPMRLAGIIGAVLILYAAGYAIHKAYDDINRTGTLSEFETLMSANMFFRGLLLVAISVMGEYVGRIYMAVSKDPQYVVREILSLRKKASRIDCLDDARKKDGRTQH